MLKEILQLPGAKDMVDKLREQWRPELAAELHAQATFGRQVNNNDKSYAWWQAEQFASNPSALKSGDVYSCADHPGLCGTDDADILEECLGFGHAWVSAARKFAKDTLTDVLWVQVEWRACVGAASGMLFAGGQDVPHLHPGHHATCG